MGGMWYNIGVQRGCHRTSFRQLQDSNLENDEKQKTTRDGSFFAFYIAFLRNMWYTIDAAHRKGGANDDNVLCCDLHVSNAVHGFLGLF